MPPILLPLALAAAFAAPADVTEDRAVWPAFNGGGRVAEDADPPTEWSGPDGTNVAWEAAIPDGQSSPVIYGDTVYATGVEGPNKERNVVVAVDLETGEEKWRYEMENSDPRESSLYVSRAAPTPCADESGVYAYFESGDLVALKTDGERSGGSAASPSSTAPRRTVSNSAAAPPNSATNCSSPSPTTARATCCASIKAPATTSGRPTSNPAPPTAPRWR